LGPANLLASENIVFLLGVNGWGVKPIAHLHLVPSLMCEVIPPLSHTRLNILLSKAQTQLHFYPFPPQIPLIQNLFVLINIYMFQSVW